MSDTCKAAIVSKHTQQKMETHSNQYIMNFGKIHENIHSIDSLHSFIYISRRLPFFIFIVYVQKVYLGIIKSSISFKHLSFWLACTLVKLLSGSL